MAYDREIERRIDAAFGTYPHSISDKLSKKKMFGGLAYLYSGKMTVGVVGDELMVRVVSEKMEDLLHQAHIRPMDFTKRPMREFVYVSPEGFRTEAQLQELITLGIEHARKVLRKA